MQKKILNFPGAGSGPGQFGVRREPGPIWEYWYYTGEASAVKMILSVMSTLNFPFSPSQTQIPSSGKSALKIEPDTYWGFSGGPDPKLTAYTLPY